MSSQILAANPSGSLDSVYLDEESTAAKVMLVAVDLGLLATLWAVPFVMGGRLAISQIVLVSSACWAALAWSAYLVLRPQTKWIWTRAEPFLFAGLAVGLIQIVQLPQFIVEALSSRNTELLPLWSNDPGALGAWTKLSYTPALTQLGLVNYAAYLLLFVVTVQRVRKIEDVERLMRWICIGALAMAVFGLVQFWTTNGKFYWFFEYPYTTTWGRVKGAFTNKNHFAQFLAIGVGPLIWWLLKSFSPPDSPSSSGFTALRNSTRKDVTSGLLLISLCVVVAAMLWSLSLGGAIAAFAATMITLSVLYKKKYISGKLIVALAATTFLVAGGLEILGGDRVVERLNDWNLQKRLMIWKTNLSIVSDYPFFGTGIGSHVESYQMYMDEPFSYREFSHAENSYLQVASETGLVGLSIAVCCVMLVLFWCIQAIRRSRSRQSTILMAAIFGGITANLVHSACDFIWYVPGCMVVIVVMAACACRLYQLTYESGVPSSPSFVRGGGTRKHWLGLIGLVLVIGTWMVGTNLPWVASEPDWWAYLRISLPQKQPVAETDNEQPKVAQPIDLTERLRLKIKSLAAVVRKNPDHARAQLRLAMGYETYFHVLQRDSENPMTLAQIRDAAWASQFPSLEAQDEWLDRALGNNCKLLHAARRHARRSLMLSPLQGHGYLYMSELCFLEGGDRGLQQSYVNQALKVRPFAAQVLFVAGRQAWTSFSLKMVELERLAENDPRRPKLEEEAKAEYGRAMAYWKGAFNRDVTYQRRITNLLIDYVTAKFMVENFQPDVDALERLEARFRELNRPDDHRVILYHYAVALIEKSGNLDNDKPIQDLLSAAHIFDQLGEDQKVLESYQAALKASPNSFKVRYTVGRWFFKREQYAEASKHLEWCLRLKQGDETLMKMVETSQRRSIALPINKTTRFK